MSVSEDKIIDVSALLEVLLQRTYWLEMDRLAGALRLGFASPNTPCGEILPCLTTAYG